jgi:tRNA modification GTPase
MNIYALSSGAGPSGIAIIRLSGEASGLIAKKICRTNELNIQQANFAKFYNPKNNEVLDEGLVIYFKGPNSYTGEDLVEFHTHGSNAVITAFTNVLADFDNCRLAEPGEFTKLALQNDKIDLLKAESIGDLIHAETELQRKQAINFIQGHATDHYNNLREKLIKALAYIEAKIDFAEEDLPDSVLKDVQNSIKEVHQEIKILLEDQKIGEKIRDGFRVSIIGQVNAGKSSLLNLLAKKEAAIVSEEEGTTRDVIEVYLNIDGYPVILSDTAGIRKTDSAIEKKGISKAIERSKESDLNIIIIDNTSEKIDKEITDLINDNSIVVLNKSDLQNKTNHQFKNNKPILLSVKKNENIDHLISEIKSRLGKKFIAQNKILITRQRHRIKLQQALKDIDNYLNKGAKKEIELAAEDLRLATRNLGGIIGKVDIEEILGSIFKDFCIGK